MHERKHTGERPFKCDRCSYSAWKKYNFILHQRTHTGDKPFKCDLCIFSAAQKSQLITHQRRHTDEKPFKCDQCVFSAAQKSHLISHQRMHTGEKPFKCDQCSYSSVFKSIIISHQRKHTDEKPFKKSQLKLHQRSHTDIKSYKCDQCNYASRAREGLISHQRRHVSGKPFKCTSSATRKKRLAVQQRRHTDDTHYECDQCNFRTTIKILLIWHCRSHSAEKIFKFSRNCGELRKPDTAGHDRQLLNHASLRKAIISTGFRERVIKVILRRLTEEEIAFYTQKPNPVDAIKREVDDYNQVGQQGIDESTTLVQECPMFDVRSIKEEPSDFTNLVPSHVTLVKVECNDVEEPRQRETVVKLEPPDYY